MPRNVHLKGTNQQGGSPIDVGRVLSEKAARTRRGTVSDPFLHQVDGYIRGKFLVYNCPVCGGRNEFLIPDIIASSVVWELGTACCQRAAIVWVRGVITS